MKNVTEMTTKELKVECTKYNEYGRTWLPPYLNEHLDLMEQEIANREKNAK